MKNSTFFKVALLIILVGGVWYYSNPHYTFDQKGTVRKNIHTGTVEKFQGFTTGWRKLDKENPIIKKKTFKLSEIERQEKTTFDEEMVSLPDGFVLDEK